MIIFNKLKSILNKDKAYDILDRYAGGDWGSGGCLILAKSLAKYMNGDVYFVIANGVVHHAIAMVNNIYIDSNGTFNSKKEVIDMCINEYMLDGDIITGDTLFVFGCGRCDLQGGDPEQMFTTLKKMKEELNKSTTILPGHNYSDSSTSTISEQIDGNPFLHFHECNDFVEYRMHTHDKVRNTPYHPIRVEDLLK